MDADPVDENIQPFFCLLPFFHCFSSSWINFKWHNVMICCQVKESVLAQEPLKIHNVRSKKKQKAGEKWKVRNSVSNNSCRTGVTWRLFCSEKLSIIKTLGVMWGTKMNTFKMWRRNVPWIISEFPNYQKTKKQKTKQKKKTKKNNCSIIKTGTPFFTISSLFLTLWLI